MDFCGHTADEPGREQLPKKRHWQLLRRRLSCAREVLHGKLKRHIARRNIQQMYAEILEFAEKRLNYGPAILKLFHLFRFPFFPYFVRKLWRHIQIRSGEIEHEWTGDDGYFDNPEIVIKTNELGHIEPRDLCYGCFSKPFVGVAFSQIWIDFSKTLNGGLAWFDIAHRCMYGSVNAESKSLGQRQPMLGGVSSRAMDEKFVAHDRFQSRGPFRCCENAFDLGFRSRLGGSNGAGLSSGGPSIRLSPKRSPSLLAGGSEHKPLEDTPARRHVFCLHSGCDRIGVVSSALTKYSSGAHVFIAQLESTSQRACNSLPASEKPFPELEIGHSRIAKILCFNPRHYWRLLDIEVAVQG